MQEMKNDNLDSLHYPLQHAPAHPPICPPGGLWPSYHPQLIFRTACFPYFPWVFCQERHVPGTRQVILLFTWLGLGMLKVTCVVIKATFVPCIFTCAWLWHQICYTVVNPFISVEIH